MSKRIALKDYVEVDGHDLSDFCRSVDFTSDHSQEDVSGFNAGGTNEYLAGPTVQTFTAEFFMGSGAGEPFDVLRPLHVNKTVFTIKWREDQTLPVSATNPQLTGNVQLFAFGKGAQRGSAETRSITFAAVDSTGLVFAET